MPSILDPKFRYTPSNKTDIRRTFAKIRRRIEDERKKESPIPAVKLVEKRNAKTG